MRLLHRRLSGVRRRRRRELALARGLPDFVVLLHIAVSAGVAPREALRAAAEVAHGGSGEALVEHVAGVLRAISLGADMTDAVALVDAHGDRHAGLTRVLDLLRRSEVDGANLDLHVEVLLQDLRRERANALDLAAQRLSVAMLVPLVVLILPAFVLLAIVPLVLDLVAHLGV